MSAVTPRALKLLIAAMGGEGGGVLTDWIVSAAQAEGLAVQSTSVPGVAQRTGATTYYVEIFPQPLRERARPVFALMPSAGDLDLIVASELMEAARAIANGLSEAGRTVAIASLHRVFAMAEKTAMGDGRLDNGRLFRAIEERARRAILFDMAETAAAAGSAINAVMLGAIAGSGVLPIAAETFEAAIRAEGKAVAANLAGFSAGLAAARGELGETKGFGTAIGIKRRRAAPPDAAALTRRLDAELAEPAREFAREGVHRLIDYQGPAYAKLYLDRLGRIDAIERSLSGDGTLTREVARQLAVRMSYEDVIRVAQLKTDPARLARIRREVGAEAHEPLVVRDFFKPGVEELCSLLPPSAARAILAFAEKRGWKEKAYFGMRVNSTSLSGFLRLRLLAGLRRWRPRTYRYEIVQADLATWLGRLSAAARLSPGLALEVAECARLVKGYGDTYARGARNCERILAAVVDRAVQGEIAAAFAEEAVLNARTAALADPEGQALERTLAAIAERLKEMAGEDHGAQAALASKGARNAL